jgi:hypothetical protein
LLTLSNSSSESISKTLERLEVEQANAVYKEEMRKRE